MRAVGDVTPSIMRRIRPRPATVDIEYDTEWTTRYQGEDIGSALAGNGAAFDLLDFRRMYKDAAGTQPVTAYGDGVSRIESHDGSARLVTDVPSLATIENVNGYPVLRFTGSRYRVEGFDTALERPVIATGTFSGQEATNVLYWYNNSGTGYGGRKWGVLIRPGQYRMFYQNGQISVVGVDSWAPYHSAIMDRIQGVGVVDGASTSIGSGAETYADTDIGFRLGGYPGSTSEMLNAVMTHFIISDASINQAALQSMTARHKTLLNL